MKKSLIVSGIIIIIAAGFGFYFFTLNKNQNKDVVREKNSRMEAERQPEANKLSEEIHPYVGDDFTIVPPNGWAQTHIPTTLVSFQNNKETHPKGGAAEKINFKSYIAVSFDNTNGKSLDETVELVKQQIKAVAPAIIFNSITEGLIDKEPAKFIEAGLSMQDVDFKIMVAVALKGDKYFTVSNNTTAEKWQEYRDIFYAAANSFKFKY